MELGLARQRRSSVVLPAPFGPASASRSRRSTLNETPSKSGVAELLPERGCDQDRHRAKRRCGVALPCLARRTVVLGLSPGLAHSTSAVRLSGGRGKSPVALPSLARDVPSGSVPGTVTFGRRRLVRGRAAARRRRSRRVDPAAVSSSSACPSPAVLDGELDTRGRSSASASAPRARRRRARPRASGPRRSRSRRSRAPPRSASASIGLTE